MQMWINPSKSLVDRALERWSSTRLRADNTSVVTLMLDPSGPCRSEVSIFMFYINIRIKKSYYNNITICGNRRYVMIRKQLFTVLEDD